MLKTKKTISKIIVSVLITAQLVLVCNFTGPKKAEAFWGIGDFSFDTTIASPYDIAKDIGIAAGKRIAMNYMNRFLNRFVDKIVDKYKIKNYLYYDQVLTNSLLNSFLRDKIDDPDLRRIYTLMESTFITGAPTGKSGGVDPRTALIPQLKRAISDLYQKQTGIDPKYIANPPPGADLDQYLTQAQYYYLNNPGYTEARIRNKYSGFQSASSTASQLEIIAGNSFKSSRSIIGGKCVDDIGPIESAKTPEACAALGDARWDPSLLDNARSFISNPTAFVEKNIDKALGVIFDGNYNPDNIWSAVGSSLGNFIFKKLDLDQQGGSGTVLNEYPVPYRRDDGNTELSVDIDIEKDGIPDGEDTDRDGDIDTCYHGGTPPGECKESSEVSSSPYFTPLCKGMDKTISSVEEYLRFASDNRNHFESGGENFINKADSDIWSRRTQRASSAVDDLMYTVENFSNPNWDQYEIVLGRYSNYLSRIMESLIKDGDLDLAWIGNGGGGIDALIRTLQDLVDYLHNVRGAIGRCDEPNDEVVNSIPTPDPGGPDPEAGDGDAPCGNLLTGGSTQGQASVRTAMDAVVPDWASSTDVSGFRDAVVDWLNNNGFEAARGHNGNCNSSANNLAIKINSSMGVLYEIARDGAGCPEIDVNDLTIAGTTPCRPLTGYVGQWSYVGQGIRP